MKKYEFKPYNPNSPKLFEGEKNRLRQFLIGNYQIEHIGSTAVPGLGGKGIIDIMLAVSKEKIQDFCLLSQKAGYIYIPEAGSKDRLFLRTEYPDDFTEKAVYHLHITYPEGNDWKEAIAFRDYLRAHLEDLKRYAEIKRKAAQEANEDTETYMRIKETILGEILTKALSLNGSEIH